MELSENWLVIGHPCPLRPVFSYSISKSPTNDAAVASFSTLYIACICSAKRAISVIGHIFRKLNLNLVPMPETGHCLYMWDGH